MIYEYVPLILELTPLSFIQTDSMASSNSKKFLLIASYMWGKN
jgi:hypothetical protein